MRQNLSYFCNVLLIPLIFLFAGCVSTGASKPNTPYSGLYPSKFDIFLKKNPLLARELGKIPEIQDGISNSELDSLNRLADLYIEIPDAFDSAFKQMYQIGHPEVRKYCSPLQACYWLVEDGGLEKLKDILNDYSLVTLLNSSWNFNMRFDFELLDLSDQQAHDIVNSIDQDTIWYSKHLPNPKDTIKLCYNQTPSAIPEKYRKLIEDSYDYKNNKKKCIRNNLRWQEFKIVIERLNSPELIDYYEQNCINYVNWRMIPHYSLENNIFTCSRYVFKHKQGDCVYITAFTTYCLRKAGYKAFEKRMKLGRYTEYFHAVCVFEWNNNRFIMDNGTTPQNGISPYHKYRLNFEGSF
jgi:hypothetical protein